MATQLPFSHISNNQATNSSNKAVIGFVKFPSKQKQPLCASLLRVFQKRPFESTKINPTKLAGGLTRARAHKAYFLVENTLIACNQLRTDLAQYRTLHSQCQLQETIKLFFIISGKTYRLRAQHSFRVTDL
jgi:hypothetical protein